MHWYFPTAPNTYTVWERFTHLRCNNTDRSTYNVTMSALASRTAMSRDSTPSESLRCWSALCLSSRHTCAVWPVTKLIGKYTAVSSIKQLSKGEEMGTRHGGWCKNGIFQTYLSHRCSEWIMKQRWFHNTHGDIDFITSLKWNTHHTN
jgi:hypothetical protein